MSVIWSLISVVVLICYSDCGCSPTSFYKSCWIRRYPGLYVDIEESQRRGAQILKVYQEETALKCSRACCMTRNFSCNLAVFHYNTTEDSVNCFHLHCWTPESCILHHRRNVILYNVTKGVDPDLLVFGKHFTTNPRVLPHMSFSRLNVSEPLTSDKRHFNHPPNPPVRSVSPSSTSMRKPTTPQQTTQDVPTAHKNHLPQCTTQTSTTDESTPEQVILTALPTTDSAPQQTSTSQLVTTNLLHATTQTNSTPFISQTNQLDTAINNTFANAHSSQHSFHTTTALPSSTVDTADPILMTKVQTSSTSKTLTTQQLLELQTTAPSSTVAHTIYSMTTPSQITTSITDLSTTTQQPPLATSISEITATKLEVSETHVSTNSSQTSTEITTTYETTQSTTPVLTPFAAFQPKETTTTSHTSTLMAPTTTSPTITTDELTNTSPTITTDKSTTIPTITTDESTITSLTITTDKSTTSSTITTDKSTTSPTITTDESTTTSPTITTDKSTTSLTITPDKSTTSPTITTNKSTTSPTVTTDESTTTSPTITTDELNNISATITTNKSTTSPTVTTDESTTTSPTITTDKSTTTRHLTTNFTQTYISNSSTTNSLSSSLTTHTSMMDSQPYPNDTKGYISRNITTDDAPAPGGDESLTSVWHLAAHTVLVALATCATITVGCCCSVFAALSWRGRRRRKGRYRTNLRGKRGSMKLIKYVIVREGS